MRYTSLQLALLALLLKAKKPVRRDQIEGVYRTAGKRKPKSANKCVASLARSTSDKLEPFARIVRLTGLGRGHAATYQLDGDISWVRQQVDAAVE